MKIISRIAWGFCILITLVTLTTLVKYLINQETSQNILALVNIVTGYMIPPAFAFLAALILSRQPSNMIGWLVMVPALLGMFLPAEDYIRSFTSAPSLVPALLVLALWFYNWEWLALILPIFFIPVLFPTGRPLTPRWRWLIIAGLVMFAIFLFIDTFVQNYEMSDFGLDWSITNPIGFIDSTKLDTYFFGPWIVGLLSLTLLSVVSLFIRYRRAVNVEREQIKWLLYACALFAVMYIPSHLITNQGRFFHDAWGIVFNLSILTIPTAIAIAILRYRLWDIDILIRRTLVYAALTATLALVFFGGVAVIQQVFGKLAGMENSPIAIVISTLGIVVLFSPLRRYIQDGIDRRFYRRKYNAEQALRRFAATARDETDIELLKDELMAVVRDAMQPEQVSLWLKE